MPRSQFQAFRVQLALCCSLVRSRFNTPRRPYEASGTSGMKAAVNGVLNCSVLDGWWVEGYTPDVGWSIGHGEDYTDPNYQDQIESVALYDILARLEPSPVVELNRAVSLAMRDGPSVGLQYVDAILGRGDLAGHVLVGRLDLLFDNSHAVGLGKRL